jgi:hypothetical protein
LRREAVGEEGLDLAAHRLLVEAEVPGNPRDAPAGIGQAEAVAAAEAGVDLVIA